MCSDNRNPKYMRLFIPLNAKINYSCICMFCCFKSKTYMQI